MNIEKAYAKRELLSRKDLEQLYQGLLDELVRYRRAIQNYPPERMEKYGEPFLKRLEGRISEVEALLTTSAV